MTIGRDRAGGASDGDRGTECFCVGVAGWTIDFSVSLVAGGSVTGTGGVGRGGSTIGRKPTPNVGDWPCAASGCGISGAVAVWSGGTGRYGVTDGDCYTNHDKVLPIRLAG